MALLKDVQVILFTISVILLRFSGAEHQKFRVKPQDMQVLEGFEALLRCEVSNLAGQVQWTKDGFALGFSAKIPGFPRYSVLGDGQHGVYNLKISNASLEDDAEYQCQVSPAKLNSAIRENAKLTVISPPASIEIQGHAHNSKVEVRENQPLTLTCTVADAKPAAVIQWFRGNVEFKPDNIENTVTETNGKRFTTISRLPLTPTADDDYTEYSCRAKQKALQPDMPMRTSVQLSVLYPPGAPYIEGYTPGETVRRGQTVELVCRSRGGNPPAQLIWYKDGIQVRMAYRTTGRLSENIYSFTAEATDNKKRFRCEANNIMSQTPLKTEIDLTVHFAPTHVTISGPSEATVADQVPLTCTTAPSNPPAEIKWTVNQRTLKNTTSKTILAPDGGWITTSNITTVVDSNKRPLVVTCHGINMQLTENVVSTHTVNILYPPSAPIISGYKEGSILSAGTVTKLLCISTGGNPLATLTWYKNDKKINSVVRTADNSVTAELTVLANVTDNKALYRCEAQNSATEIPLFETKTLSVHFAPETVKIRYEPEELKPGLEAILTCDSSSSNPPAQISWWREGIPVEGFNNQSKDGLWGGMVGSIQLKINITEEMNGVIYTCQSINTALQRSIHEAIALKVLFPPKFVPPPSSIAVGMEGDPLHVAVVAHGNPMSIAYTWTKDNAPIITSGPGGVDRIVSEGPILNITKSIRSDSGLYTCEAVNSQGSAVINITIRVEYSAEITAISENVIVNPGEDAELSCSVEGNPLVPSDVRWERVGYDMDAKTSTSFSNGTSYLKISKATRADVGVFRCIADNRVENPTSRDVFLIVRFAPEIVKTSPVLRAASAPGDRGKIVCRAQAVPKPTFLWRRSGHLIDTIAKDHLYGFEVKQIDNLTYESILTIKKVTASDFDTYECVAKNEFGESKEPVILGQTSSPDPPTGLNVLNATHDAVTLAWTPGFDGGMKATYRIRYREINSEHYYYEDGLPNTHKLTVAGLKMNTMYLFSVSAINPLGNSRYLPDTTKVQTKGFKAPDMLVEKAEMPKLVVVGIILAALGVITANVGLVAWFIIRKRNKEAQNSKSATVEMYAPSSYNDTVTGETLSSVSEKSDSYSNEGSQPDYLDETRKKSSSTYLVESSDIPPPRYQKDGTLPMHYPNNIGNSVHTRTLPRHSELRGLREDQLMAKNVGVPSPVPAPPLDGSYCNMNSDRYLSYPPMDYSPMDFSTSTAMQMQHMPSSAVLPPASCGGTLRRGVRGIVPPPDVTHHTAHSKSTHDLHNGTNSPAAGSNIIPMNKPLGILKDPNRLKQQQQHNNMQILNVQTAPGGGGGNGGLLTYDPASVNLSTFNVTMGYTDADGHLV